MTMRLIAVAIATLFVPGCSSSPSTPTGPAAAHATAASKSTTAGTTTSATVATAAAYPGYKMKQHNGRTLYCKKLGQTGTRFQDEICMTEFELETFMREAERDREQLRRAQSNCGMAGCGSASE
jgi:hypothetical protein